jgi:hypothetical protein
VGGGSECGGGEKRGEGLGEEMRRGGLSKCREELSAPRLSSGFRPPSCSPSALRWRQQSANGEKTDLSSPRHSLDPTQHPLGPLQRELLQKQVDRLDPQLGGTSDFISEGVDAIAGAIGCGRRLLVRSSGWARRSGLRVGESEQRERVRRSGQD